MAAMDAVCKQETDGAPQIWFAGLPGNSADFPMNDMFDTFAEQAQACFLEYGNELPLFLIPVRHPAGRPHLGQADACRYFRRADEPGLDNQPEQVYYRAIGFW